MKFDLVIEGGCIVCMDARYTILEEHCIGIIDGRIEAIFPRGSSAYSVAKRIDASNCLVIPGMINAHSHLPMTYFRGLADDLPLHQWLQEYIWPLEAKLVNPAFVFDATLHGAAEMIQNGISCTNDMYFHMASIADACTQAGLRVVIGEALIDPMGSQPIDNKIIGSKVKELKQQYQANPLVDFSLAPHSIYTCRKATLEQCAKVAAENGFMVHMHLSESEKEVQDCIHEHGKTPVAYLQSLGMLDALTVFAHGIWVDESEMELLAKHGNSSIAVCTESNLKLISGFAPLKSYTAHGINLCLATDGVASNNNLDLLSELSLTAKLHKALNNDTGFLSARDAFSMVTINAAKALGRQQDIGSLEVGKLADIAILSVSELENLPMYNPYSHLAYATTSRSVRDMVIQGKPVMLDRKLCLVDESLIINKASEYKTMILKEIK
ncbi:MAG: cytosine deaminase [Candidatus Cloacimonetes bacterium HGW-Cloacimonetes-3]|jgi:5-methylthioadenosine/S-adenosylhomocysteine deaminase|nr:MAG: cytosine deaminase [Candidatus Cloacimonetes bacterium HGW-Cloacimonetes-3]